MQKLTFPVKAMGCHPGPSSSYSDSFLLLLYLCNRPFERTITLQKDSAGTVGFVFKENKITAIVKDSSAARNGVLIDHHMVEVNGQNVIGMKVTVFSVLKAVIN